MALVAFGSMALAAPGSSQAACRTAGGHQECIGVNRVGQLTASLTVINNIAHTRVTAYVERRDGAWGSPARWEIGDRTTYAGLVIFAGPFPRNTFQVGRPYYHYRTCGYFSNASYPTAPVYRCSPWLWFT